MENIERIALSIAREICYNDKNNAWMQGHAALGIQGGEEKAMTTQQRDERGDRCVLYTILPGRDPGKDLRALCEMGANSIQAPLEMHPELAPLCREAGLELKPAAGTTSASRLADYEYALVADIPVVIPFWEEGGCSLLQPDGEWGDLFYLCRAFWCREPFVRICRCAVQEGRGAVVKAYSNLPSITLLVNGRVTEKRNAAHIFIFEDVPVRLIGRNILAVQNGECRDSMRIERSIEQVAPRSR